MHSPFRHTTRDPASTLSLRPGRRHQLATALLMLAVCLFAGCSQAPAPAPADSTQQPADQATGSTTEGTGQLKRLILLTNGNSPFWDACRSGLQDAERELNLAASGLRAVLEVNDGTPEGQLDKLRQYGTQSDIAAIGISVIDAANAAIAEEMRKLRAKGVHVITIDSDVDREKYRDARYAFLGTDNFAAGRVLGQCARTLRSAGGEYVTFVGRTGAQNAIDRVGGFAEGAGDTFTQLDNMGDDVDLDRARDNVRNALVNHPGLDMLVGIWSYNAPAIVDVVRDTDSRERLTVVAFDAEPGAVRQMAEGMIDALLVQNPYEMGYRGVRVMQALVVDDSETLAEVYPNLEQPGGDISDTGLKIVVPDGETRLAADQFPEGVQFLQLKEFRAWLSEYGLEGS